MSRVQPTQAVAAAVNKLLASNARTRDATVEEMYLQGDLLVIRLKRQKVVEGTWVERSDLEIDMVDLMEMHRNEQR